MMMSPICTTFPKPSLWAKSLIFLALATVIGRAEPVLKPNDTLAICGDSITEQKMYSVFIEDYILMCGPVKDVRTIAFGWGGERAGGFTGRVQNDILVFKPTVVTTCYGMNDGNYRAMEQATDDLYRKDMGTAIKQIKDAGVRTIIIGSPGAVDTSVFKRPNTTAEVYNQTLGSISDIAKDIAAKDGLGFADVHTPMMQTMEKAKAAIPNYILCGAADGVHPGPDGHLVMAYAFLKALGFDGAVGTITVDLASGKAEGTDGQKIVASLNGTTEIESTRYPFCFTGDPTKADQSTASVLQFLPFNEDLNRYMLVVKGLKGAKAKVTWGKETKEFSTADLEKGINLAAEFLTNPFSDQFKKVNDAVLAQQAHETILVKSFLHNLPAFKAMTPTETASLDKVAQAGRTRDEDLFSAAKALVTPVRHTIKVESVP